MANKVENQWRIMGCGFADGKHSLEVTAKDAKGAKERYWYLVLSRKFARCFKAPCLGLRITRPLLSRALELRQRSVFSRIVKLRERLCRRICPLPFNRPADGFFMRQEFTIAKLISDTL